MFKKSIASMILSMFIPPQVAPAMADGERHAAPIVKGKGQLRAAKPKASGAAQLKRAAKKAKNKRK